MAVTCGHQNTMLVTDGAAKKVVCNDCRAVVGIISETLGKSGDQHKSFAEKVGEEPLEKAN